VEIGLWSVAEFTSLRQFLMAMRAVGVSIGTCHDPLGRLEDGQGARDS
jgi:hypothetical protein